MYVNTETDFVIKLTKEGRRSTPDKTLKMQIDYIKDRLMAGNRSKKWVLNTKQYYNYDEGERVHYYTVDFHLTWAGSENANVQNEYNNCLGIVHKAASFHRWNSPTPQVEDGDEEFSDISYVDISIGDDWFDTHFSHIYGRQPQIEIVKSCIQAGIDSSFENRFHTVLYGDPACGKSEIARSFKQMFGEDAVLEYDATSTTQAGAIKDLNDRTVMPRILVVEEIEKCDESSLRWLLSVLDFRGEIRKVNARQQIQKEVRLVCVATANDYTLFKNMMYGALASRFAHHVYCPRPDKEILYRIIKREVDAIGGDERWITPAIEFAELCKETDPRRVTAICLCGKDNLLDKSYQSYLYSTLSPDIQQKFDLSQYFTS